jgi:hypothetical protein
MMVSTKKEGLVFPRAVKHQPSECVPNVFVMQLVPCQPDDRVDENFKLPGVGRTSELKCLAEVLWPQRLRERVGDEAPVGTNEFRRRFKEIEHLLDGQVFGPTCDQTQTLQFKVIVAVSTSGREG